MRLTPEELHARLDQLVGDDRAATPELASVRTRARRRRSRRRLAGVVAVAVLAAAATAVTMSVGDDDATVVAGPPVVAKTTTTAPGGRDGNSRSVRRVVDDRRAVTVAESDPLVVFGPYGRAHRWVAPSACWSDQFLVTISTINVTTVYGPPSTAWVVAPQTGVVAMFEPLSDRNNTMYDAGPVKVNDIIVVRHPIPSHRYEAIIDGTVVDSTAGDSDPSVLLVDHTEDLSGRDPGSITPRPVLLREVDQQGRTVSERTPPTLTPQDPEPPGEGCVPPSTPPGLPPASTAASQDPADIAIRELASSMLVPGHRPLTDVADRLDDPKGRVAAALAPGDAGDSRHPTVNSAYEWLRSEAVAIYRDSETHAWFTWTAYDTSPMAASPDEALPLSTGTPWAEATRVDGTWKLTSESACATLTFHWLLYPTTPRCTGSPQYLTEESAAGQPHVK